jgi:hypothetical protein
MMHCQITHQTCKTPIDSLQDSSWRYLSFAIIRIFEAEVFSRSIYQIEPETALAQLRGPSSEKAGSPGDSFSEDRFC